jgi:16S rRNA (cytosine967-C5)-methyltransferase
MNSKEKYPVKACKSTETALVFQARKRFLDMPEFQQGHFEVQDEASQIVAGLIKPKPGHAILDYCAGSGGKTLAFAPTTENKGQIYLHDVMKSALIEVCKKNRIFKQKNGDFQAKIRLRRAGVQNAQVIQPEDFRTKEIKNSIDL